MLENRNYLMTWRTTLGRISRRGKRKISVWTGVNCNFADFKVNKNWWLSQEPSKDRAKILDADVVVDLDNGRERGRNRRCRQLVFGFETC